MKSFLLAVFFLFTLQIIHAQLPPWNLEFYVYHPNGYTDTLWVGCDETATVGYDEGLDIIDTTFSTPIAMRGFSQEVEDEFNLGTCVNLKKNIQPFGYPVEFTFYILHDEISTSDSIYLGWDNSMLNYEVGDYWISEVSIFSYYGYLEGIDGENYLIMHRISDSSIWLGFAPIPIFSLTETLPCFNNSGFSENLLKIVLKVYFKDYGVLIEDNNAFENLIHLYPNPSTSFINVQSQFAQSVEAYIYNYLGETIDDIKVNPGKQDLDISNLLPGIYYIKFHSNLPTNSFTFKFIKL